MAVMDNVFKNNEGEREAEIKKIQANLGMRPHHCGT